MKRFYWKETLMLSAPVGIIALGLVFVKVRSNEPTQSLLSKWPDKAQITKCEVRPATPLEISQGADFGLTMQTVSPNKPRPIQGISYSISEPATKMSLPESPLMVGRHEYSAQFHQAAHPLQQDYHAFEETDSFKRSDLKSKDGVIEVDVKVGWRRAPDPLVDKVFRLNTKQIPLPDVVAVRKANFRITKVELGYFNETAVLPTYIVRIHVDRVVDVSQGLMSSPQTVGKWTMEGHPNQKFFVGINTWGIISKEDYTVKYVDFQIYFYARKHPRIAGSKFRGLLSIGRGWPQEITLEFTELKDTGLGDFEPEVKFTAKLAPFPK